MLPIPPFMGTRNNHWLDFPNAPNERPFSPGLQKKDEVLWNDSSAKVLSSKKSYLFSNHLVFVWGDFLLSTTVHHHHVWSFSQPPNFCKSKKSTKKSVSQGGGGALFREKIVEMCAKKFLGWADCRKPFVQVAWDPCPHQGEESLTQLT